MNKQVLNFILENEGFEKPERSKLDGIDGEFIRDVRTEAGLSHETFAEIVGVAKGTVRSWERGTVLPGYNPKTIVMFLKEAPEKGVSLFERFAKAPEKKKLTVKRLVQLSFYDGFLRNNKEDVSFYMEDTPKMLKEKYDVSVSDENIKDTLNKLFVDLISFGEMVEEEDGKLTFFPRGEN